MFIDAGEHLRTLSKQALKVKANVNGVYKWSKFNTVKRFCFNNKIIRQRHKERTSCCIKRSTTSFT